MLTSTCVPTAATSSPPAGVSSFSTPHSDDFEWTYDITVAAGGPIVLLTFGVQAGMRSDAQTAASSLVDLPSEALDGLDPILTNIVSFRVGGAPLISITPAPPVDEGEEIVFDVEVTDRPGWRARSHPVHPRVGTGGNGRDHRRDPHLDPDDRAEGHAVRRGAHGRRRRHGRAELGPDGRQQPPPSPPTPYRPIDRVDEVSTFESPSAVSSPALVERAERTSWTVPVPLEDGVWYWEARVNDGLVDSDRRYGTFLVGDPPVATGAGTTITPDGGTGGGGGGTRRDRGGCAVSTGASAPAVAWLVVLVGVAVFLRRRRG